MQNTISLALWSGVAIGLGAIVAAWLSRRTKISEFRHDWIKDLRTDIANYIGASDRWMSKRDEINLLSHDERKNQISEVDRLSNEARVILHRIELRINPRNNQYKNDDDIFLRSLWDLLDPQAVAGTSWRALAGNSVGLGRELLKREWEVTKKIFF